MKNNNEETKKSNNVAFWKREGKYGEFYSSNVITAANFDELQKLEVGGQLTLNFIESENEKSPQLYLKVQTKDEVEARKAKSGNGAAKKTFKRRSQEDDI